MLNYLDEFKKSDLTYSELAVTLGVCELSARNKLSGKARLTKLEKEKLDQLFSERKGD